MDMLCRQSIFVVMMPWSFPTDSNCASFLCVSVGPFGAAFNIVSDIICSVDTIFVCCISGIPAVTETPAPVTATV